MTFLMPSIIEGLACWVVVEGDRGGRTLKDWEVGVDGCHGG